jgi:ribosome-associated heat shock protein Hsp15
MTGEGRTDAPADTQRLDKWLWFARIAKSRTLAASLVAEGKIKVNRERVRKPSHAVKVGDVITSSVKKDVRIMRVVAAGTRRGPATEAQGLYEDLTPVGTPPARGAKGLPSAGQSASGERAPGSGRPTKRDRRRIDLLKESHH